MDYYKKYLSLLKTSNNIIGGRIETKGENTPYSKFYNKGKILHYPLTWNLQNNQFS